TLRSAAGWSAWEGLVGSWSSRGMLEASGFMRLVALPQIAAGTPRPALVGGVSAAVAPDPAITDLGAGSARGSDSAAGSSASDKATLAAGRRRGGFARDPATGGGAPGAANRGIWSCVIFSLAQELSFYTALRAEQGMRGADAGS